MVYALDTHGIPESRTTHKQQRWEVRLNERADTCVGGVYWDKKDAVRELERLTDPFCTMPRILSIRDVADQEGDLCYVRVTGKKSGFILYEFEILEVNDT